MNVHDSSRIVEIMEQNGYELIDDPLNADLILINTCSVREKAWHKAVSETGRMCTLKQNRPDLVVVVVGCVAQQEGEKWFERIPRLDLVVGPDHYLQLPELVDQVRGRTKQQTIIGFDNGPRTGFLSAGATAKAPVSTFVTVMKGCSEKCSYCIVPTVRGPERCRCSDDIVREVEQLVGNGAKEIMLLGQKVNSYSEENLSFAGLLLRLDQIPGLERLRFTSPHPRHMDDELLQSFGRLRTLCESIHLPAQSGSERVLKRMGRRYTAQFYREVVHKLKAERPDIMISTDLIVGFPGETEADFEETVRLVEDMRFSGVFSFKYSPRPGTVAAELLDDVQPEEKGRRLAKIHEVVTRVEREIREDLVGKKLEVLVERGGRNQGQVTGRARNNQIINFIPDRSATISEMQGELAEVEVIRALPHCLEGSSI